MINPCSLIVGIEQYTLSSVSDDVEVVSERKAEKKGSRRTYSEEDGDYNAPNYVRLVRFSKTVCVKSSEWGILQWH